MGKRLPDVDELLAPDDSAYIYADLNNHDYRITLAALHAQERARLNSLEGAQYYEFDNSSLLTTQVDALPVESTYRGKIASYGYQSETGMPENQAFYVDVFNSESTSYRFIKIASMNSGTEYINTKSNGSWSGWTKLPARAEITSIYSDFADSVTSSDKITFTPLTGSTYANYGGCYYYKKGNQVHVHIGMSGLTSNSQQDVLTLPSGYKPLTDMVFVGTGGLSYTAFAKAAIYTNGIVRVSSVDTYAMIDCFFVCAS